MAWSVSPTKGISGTLRVPPSKSLTMRALLFASLAEGVSPIHAPLKGKDTDSMIKACIQLGAKITPSDSGYLIEGVGGLIDSRTRLIDSGNSGIIWRFMSALVSLGSGISLVTGDQSILNKRPITPLIEALQQAGVKCKRLPSSKLDPSNLKGPLLIQGPLSGGQTLRTTGLDSQPISALLIASCFLQAPTKIIVKDPSEKEWVEMTLTWLRKRGAKIVNNNYSEYFVEPLKTTLNRPSWKAFNYTIPGDYSTATFLVAIALITKSKFRLEGLCLKNEDHQGDQVVIDWLRASGALIYEEDGALIVDGPESKLQGMELDLSKSIDSLPILAVLCLFAQTKSRLYGIEGARHKESDRVDSIYTELKKMGGILSVHEDEMYISPSNLVGSNLETHSDHRIQMALSAAALGASTSSMIKNTHWAYKTYENFKNDLNSLGAKIEEMSTPIHTP